MTGQEARDDEREAQVQADIREGLRQSAAGEVHDLGSFAGYVEDEREALIQAPRDSERLRQLAEWLSMEHSHEETAKRINLIADRHDALAARYREHPEPEGLERSERWYVAGHPAWPDPISFQTREQAERHYWENPKLDGTRDGIRIIHLTTLREPPYVPVGEGGAG